MCPAPCESACVLSINDQPVTIKAIEKEIIDHGWEHGWVTPLRPSVHTGKRVGRGGLGPAGMAAAQQLTRAGHDVVVYERDDRPGGLVRYGIPDFKMTRPSGPPGRPDAGRGHGLRVRRRRRRRPVR